MKPVTSAEMRLLDQTAIQDFAIPSLLLMENAGRGVAQILSREFMARKVLIVAGKGNNGGDGFVVARHLANQNYLVQVVLLEDPQNLKPDPLVNYTILQKMNIPVKTIRTEIPEADWAAQCEWANCIVDAIFGVGFHGRVEGVFAQAISAICESQRPVVSVDIPSGLDADTGEIQGVAIKATVTATLALPKRGLFEGNGPEYSGKVEIIDIGIPNFLLKPYLV